MRARLIASSDRLDRVREWSARTKGGLQELELLVSMDAIDSGFVPIVASESSVVLYIACISSDHDKSLSSSRELI